MTAFLLFDELEREAEPLEEHPARHAAALSMYCLIGQKCAQRMTDGLVHPALIAKTFAAWPRAMVSTAVADLCGLGLWADVDGELRFADWDLRQPTREKEIQRREKQAARQRARRSGTKATLPNVTRDVPRGVARDVRSPSSSSSSSSSDPLPRPQPDQRGESAPSGATPSVGSGHLQIFRDTFAAEAAALGWTLPPDLPHSQLRQAAERAQRYARTAGCDYQTACFQLSRAGLQKARAQNCPPGLALLEAEPGTTYQSRAKASRVVERSRATTGADFVDAEPVEVQLARIGT